MGSDFGSDSGSDSDSQEKDEVEVDAKWSQEGDIIKRVVKSDGTTVQFKIGDKIEYNEGSGNTSSVKADFQMEELEWRVLGINEQGQLQIISTKPTDGTVTLSGESAWTDAETTLDTLCYDLYGKGQGAEGARNLKIQDIDKLAGITTDTQKQALRSNYSTNWQYQFSTQSNKIQYRKSTDNKTTWTEWSDTQYERFAIPGEGVISSSNHIDSNGAEIIVDLTDNFYKYNISTQIPTAVTSDGILLAEFITNGLNDANNAAYNSNKTQWISSKCYGCSEGVVYYVVQMIIDGEIGNGHVWDSTQDTKTPVGAIRPVVTLSLDAQVLDTDNNSIPNVS